MANEGAENPNEWAYSDVKKELNGSAFLEKENGFSAPVRLDLVYQVSFDANGGTGSKESFLYDKDTDYTLPECRFAEPQDKEFVKWNLGEAGVSIKITEDTVLKAVWKEKFVKNEIVDDKVTGGKYMVTSLKKKNGKVTGGTVTYVKPKDINCKTIIIKGTKLKKIGANAFQGIHSKAKFKVPKKKLARYQKMIKKAGAPKKANITK